MATSAEEDRLVLDLQAAYDRRVKPFNLTTDPLLGDEFSIENEDIPAHAKQPLILFGYLQEVNPGFGTYTLTSKGKTALGL